MEQAQLERRRLIKKGRRAQFISGFVLACGSVLAQPALPFPSLAVPVAGAETGEVRRLTWDVPPFFGVGSGYNLYFGTNLGVYTDRLPVGTNFQDVVFPAAGTTYVVATHTNQWRGESAFSKPFIWPKPVTNYLVFELVQLDELTGLPVATNWTSGVHTNINGANPPPGLQRFYDLRARVWQ